MIDLAGLLATAALLVTIALLVTLVALELRRAGRDAERPTRLLGLTVSRRVVGVMWVMYLILFVPRVVGLLT